MEGKVVNVIKNSDEIDKIVEIIRERSEIDRILANRVKIEIEMDKGEVYTTSIVSVKNRSIYIEMPPVTIGKKKRYIMIKDKEHVTVNIIASDGVFSFKEKVIMIQIDTPVPYFIVNFPTEIEVLQRRNFQRIYLNVPVNIKSTPLNIGNQGGDIDVSNLTQNVKEFKGVVMNMSGGGFYILALRNMNEGDLVVCDFELPNKSIHKGIIAEVRRKDIIMTQARGERFGYGLQFIDIKNENREQIIEYLDHLEKMRKDTENEVKHLLEG